MIKPSVHVLDDISGHAGPLRSSALAASYDDVVYAGDGVEVLDDRIAPAPKGSSSALISAAVERLGARSRLITSVFRAAAAEDDLCFRVAGGGRDHPASHVALMSLADPHARSRPHKVALWRHAPSGAAAGSGAPTLDRFRSSAWAMAGLVPLLNDRLVIIPTDAYISLWPVSPGTALTAADRLLWVAYVDIHSA